MAERRYTITLSLRDDGTVEDWQIASRLPCKTRRLIARDGWSRTLPGCLDLAGQLIEDDAAAAKEKPDHG